MVMFSDYEEALSVSQGILPWGVFPNQGPGSARHLSMCGNVSPTDSTKTFHVLKVTCTLKYLVELWARYLDAYLNHTLKLLVALHHFLLQYSCTQDN